jgi:predicted ATPase/class 3 adenylate cyclase
MCLLVKGSRLVGPPSGTVTFLFTDIEGSTRLWEATPDAMSEALERHDSIVRSVIESAGGYVFSTGGDGFAAAFARAGDAIGAAVEAQRVLSGEESAKTAPIRVRMGLHTGEADERDGGYFGAVVNRAARLMASAHGGQVVVSRATADLVGDRFELVDLGEHRLRDLVSVEQVFQLGHGEFPPLTTLELVPGNLPAQVTEFIGRVDELGAVSELVRTHRLATLTGPGGVGKTRLALQLAANRSVDYPDGAWWCDLAPITDPALVVGVVSAVFGLEQHAGQPLEQVLVEHLARKRLLLLVDNCEHLLDAAAAVVDVLIRATVGVSVLATSREPLGLDAEHVWRVPSFRLPAEGEGFEELAGADAVRLFTERAQAANGDFRLDLANAPAVAEVCRRLDGIPLAIELAAARSTVLSPADLAARLDERFQLLTGGRRRSVERHQTLRNTIDWSYNLLSEAERAVFDRVSVFAGGFGLAAAEAVVGASDSAGLDVLDTLAGLIDKSLLVANETGGSLRYRLLETLRAYGWERLVARDEAEATRQRHARYFAGMIMACNSTWMGAGAGEGLQAVANELDNVRAALDWFVDHGDVGEVMALADAVRSFWYIAPFEVLGWLEAVLDRRSLTADQACDIRAIACYTAGILTHKRSCLRHAAACAALSDDLGRPMPSTASWAKAFISLCDANSQGTVDDCVAGVEVARAEGDPWMEHIHLTMWASALVDLGREDEARAVLVEARKVSAQYPNPIMVGTEVYGEAKAWGGRDPQRAVQIIEASRDILDSTGPAAAGWLDYLLTAIYARQHRDGLAASAAARSLRVSQPVLNTYQVASGLETAGGLLCRNGQLDVGLRLIGVALRRWDELDLKGQAMELALRAEAIAAARRLLGDEECDAALQEGRRMAVPDAVDLALGALDQLTHLG